MIVDKTKVKKKFFDIFNDKTAVFFWLMVPLLEWTFLGIIQKMVNSNPFWIGMENQTIQL
jgi:hypothetical protein